MNNCLQHAFETLATYTTCATSPIYFCNIHMIQLQHTSETTETYNCNMGGERAWRGDRHGRRICGHRGSQCRSRATRLRRGRRRGHACPRIGVEAGGGRPEKRMVVAGGGRVDQSSCSRRGRRRARVGGRGRQQAHRLCDVRGGGGGGAAR